MADIAIRVENLGKVYRLGLQDSKSRTALGALTRGLTAPVRNLRRLWRLTHFEPEETGDDVLWALRDVSFEVKKGEVMGVIGRNGAGKTTLLKILSRITDPTVGHVDLRGRVASLLEVGTGFHPELSGRDNIFLNGAILGMRKYEIARKFDEIVDFAGLEKFIDTPVKRYSSGMYVRLAFAVAAHLEPEILLVDEVLAVGDFEFQRKCIGKMEDVSVNEGRTVLFVSHNMAALHSFCQRGVVFDRGEVKFDGEMSRAIDFHLEAPSLGNSTIKLEGEAGFACEELEFVKAGVRNDKGEERSALDASKCFSFFLEYRIKIQKSGLRIGFILKNQDGVVLCGATDFDYQEEEQREKGLYCSEVLFPSGILNSGDYTVTFGADYPPYFDQVILLESCLGFTVEDFEAQGRLKMKTPGVIKPKIKWKVGKVAG